MSARNNNSSLVAVAYERIINAIRSEELRSGERIVETELASWIGISRTPVREAIRRLESEGLITSTPHLGLTIAKLDYQSIIELYQMREVLESSAASLAAQHASDVEIDTLKELFKLEQNSPEEYDHRARLNEAFHDALYRAAHNRYLLKELNGLRDSLTLLGKTTYVIEGRPQSALEEHQQIIDAIEARDPKRAEEASRRHIKSAQQLRIRMINGLV